MRTRPGLGLLLLATLIIQVSLAEDLYWEGEEDTSNEFLEVKVDDSVTGHHKRYKRGWFDFILPTTSTTPAPENEVATEDDTIFDKDDDEHIEGSGSIPEKGTIDLNPVGEKTLRVTFVVMQPYQDEYSNRDSPQFQQFSKTLAQAVNELFDNLPGSQKASLIRIQSRLADNFSCKVTLDIVTTGYDNTDKITETLHDHIRNYRYLGGVSVKEDDFSANVVNPGSAFETCQIDEIQCDDGNCISGDARCNGSVDCNDGSDEQGCPIDETYETRQQTNTVDVGPNAHVTCPEPIACASSSVTICKEQLCDGFPDCPSGDDEEKCYGLPEQGPERGDQSLYTTPASVDQPETTSYYIPEQYTCPNDEFRCDETRCIPKSKLCDQEDDCNDGTDEINCPVSFLHQNWKSVRDNHMREKKQQTKENSGSAAKKPCPYFVLLQCLQVTKQPRNSSSNITIPENMNNDSNMTCISNDEDIDQQLELTKTELTSTQPASMSTFADQNQPSTSRQPILPQQKKSVSQTNKMQNMIPFQESHHKQFVEYDGDANRYFLLSLLPEMSKMTESQNFEFRMEIMKALNKVKYQI